MLFHLLERKKPPQSATEDWRAGWQALFAPECRNVPVTCGGETRIAYLQVNHFVVMLQDGLLMRGTFFDVCEFFQKAGYHVIWLMRCSQDISGGFLKKLRMGADGRTRWIWRSPTTNFGRWTSDNFSATILLQPEEPADLGGDGTYLHRVVWAESDDATRMIPGRTEFVTVAKPKNAAELISWISGDLLGGTGGL